MSRVCEITGARTQVGMNVSHSNRHTKRTFKPNLQPKTYFSPLLKRNITLRLSTRAIRTLDKYNGLDGFMLQVKNKQVREKFSLQATRLRKAIVKLGATEAPAPTRRATGEASNAKKAKAPAKKKA